MEDTHLTIAALRGEVEKVMKLLKEGAKVNEVTRGGLTALHRAAQTMEKGGGEIARELLSRGASVNARSKEGRTPLGDAVYMGNEDVVEFLLKRGSEVNGHPIPLLYEAIKYARGIGIVRLLLEHGASVSVPADCGPLICMAVFCNSETVKLLLKYGVNADTKDIYGNTAMRLAVQISSDYAVRALAEYDADICFIYEGRSLLYSAVSKGDAEIVLTLLLHGANIAWDEDVTPTVWEMSRRDPRMKKALLHFWTPANHHRHPKQTRETILCVLKIAKREQWMFDNSILHLLFSYIAYPTPIQRRPFVVEEKKKAQRTKYGW